jgi:glycerol uptake facilitator protein
MAAPPSTTQKLIAEGIGTAFLVYVGAGSAAATGVISAGTKVPFSMAQLGMISFAFMLVIVGAVYAIGHISGGHINPAVTLALAVSGKFPWREVPGYIAAQLVGAVAGAAAIFLTLGKATAVAAGGGVTSYNAATMGFGRAGLIEAIGTFMLVFVIFGVIDHRAVPGWAPMAIGSVVFAIIIILGPATGAAINPARYLGAVFMQDAFGGTVSWAQVPAYLIGDLVGGVLGGLAYVAIGRVRADAAMTSLAPVEGPDAEADKPQQRLSGATS